MEAELKEVRFLHKGEHKKKMIGIGGTIRAVKKFNNERFGMGRENDRIPVGNMQLLLEEFKDEEKQILNKILRVAPDRVHTLIPGMIILDTVCRYCGCDEIVMSSFGVREGYLYKKVVGKKVKETIYTQNRELSGSDSMRELWMKLRKGSSRF